MTNEKIRSMIVSHGTTQRPLSCTAQAIAKNMVSRMLAQATQRERGIVVSQLAEAEKDY